MVSSTGARLLVTALVVALGQVLLSAVPTFVGSAPRYSHQLRLSSSRQQDLQGHKVTAHFFKKLLNRKKTANVAETVPDVTETVPDDLEAAVLKSTDAALKKEEPAPPNTISTLHAQGAEPVKTREEQLEPVVNFMIDDEAVTSPEVAAQKDAVVEPTKTISPQSAAQKDAVVEPAREGSMDDFSFKVTDADSPVTSLLKKQDDLYEFFVQLQEQLEIRGLWGHRHVVQE